MLKSQALRATLISGAVAILAGGAMLAPAQAEDGRNAAAIAGAVGGFAAGAALGSAARGPHYYDPPYTATTRVYRDRRVIVEDDEPECRMIVRRSVNAYGERVVKRVRVCD